MVLVKVGEMLSAHNDRDKGNSLYVGRGLPKNSVDVVRENDVGGKAVYEHNKSDRIVSEVLGVKGEKVVTDPEHAVCCAGLNQ